MIPFGRKTVDRRGIAKLHDLPWSTAERVKPWDDPEHPAPVAGSGTNKHPYRWDQIQAKAYADGRPTPPLPTEEHPGDALDGTEAAHFAGMNPEHWRQDVERGLIDPPDLKRHDVRYWSRAAAEAVRDKRTTRRSGGGRPAGSTESIKRAEIPARVAQALAEMEQEGRKASAQSIAARLGVAVTTARRHLAAIRSAETNPETRPD